MSQYTFSFTYTEYERIPHTLAEKYESIIAASAADTEAKALARQICDATLEAISDLAKYSKAQLYLK